jgi:predicted dehydrogenase/threonine dehydrogenase-like Zn-dependent dehydrogenase
MSERVKSFFNTQANARLARLGLSERMIREVKREGWWWLKARGQAARRARGLVRGHAVVWTDSGRCELVPIDEPAAGRGEVTVRLETSVVSPGTERAQYLRLPNARVRYPHRPGYSAAGTVVLAGRGSGYRRGDRVALAVPHASVTTAPASGVFGVPDGVPVEEAALIQLGIISGQGVRRAAIRPGEPVCVVGAGLVGLLAQRLALAAGASAATVVAASRSKEAAARAGGAGQFLVAGEDADEIAALAAPVVIEATGDPDVLALAVAAAGPEGRVVLLGSPRGTTRELPVGEIRRKRLRLVGAHISTLRRGGDASAYRREGEEFLRALAEGRVRAADLVETTVDPREADRFYRELARSRGLVAARFDWSRLPAADRAAPTSYVRPPALGARGVEFGRRPAAPAARERLAPLLAEDPFAGASGRLRIGLLGCGDIAWQNAAGVDAAPNTELVACFDPVAALAGELARRFGAEAVPSAEALLRRADVDAVFLAVPHHLHAPLALQAAAAGKHVIVEKPPANSLAAAVEMVRGAERAGVVLTVCFPQRYQPAAVAARRLIEAGAIGEPTGTFTSFLADRPASYWLGGFSGRAQSGWRASREQAGGGVLIMNLSHHVDLVRHLVGVEVESVGAQTGSLESRGEVEDTISLSIRYANGAVGTLFGSTAVRGTAEGRTSSELRVWGTDGHVSVEGEPELYTLRAIDGIRTGRWTSLAPLPSTQIRAVFVSRFATALDRGVEPDVTAADALAAQAFIEAAYRSAELGRAVCPADLLAEAGA